MPEPKAEPAPKKEEVHVGSSIGMSGRNPLDLIKTDAPLLSEAKTTKAKRALAPLLDAAGRDEACVWYRVRATDPSGLQRAFLTYTSYASVGSPPHCAANKQLAGWLCCTRWLPSLHCL